MRGLEQIFRTLNLAHANVVNMCPVTYVERITVSICYEGRECFECFGSFTLFKKFQYESLVLYTCIVTKCRVGDNHISCVCYIACDCGLLESPFLTFTLTRVAVRDAYESSHSDTNHA